MINHHVKVVFVAVVLASATACALLLEPVSPPATISLVKVEQVRDEDREYLVATFVLTNTSKHPICYVGSMNAAAPLVQELHQTNGVWKKDEVGFMCGNGLIRTALLPGQAVTFDTWIDKDRPTKIALEYSTQRRRERLAAKLPDWVLVRIPSLTKEKTLLSGEIDPGAFTDIPFRSEPKSNGLLLSRWDSLQRLADKGDRDAQFELAEFSWTNQFLGLGRLDLKYYEMAATNGHVQAAYNAGAIYDYLIEDSTNAIKWYTIASQLGHAGAKLSLQELGVR